MFLPLHMCTFQMSVTNRCRPHVRLAGYEIQDSSDILHEGQFDLDELKQIEYFTLTSVSSEFFSRIQ